MALGAQVSEHGVKVIVKNDEGEAVQLMDHPIYRIAFVCNQGKSVIFISKRRMDSDTDQVRGRDAAASAAAQP